MIFYHLRGSAGAMEAIMCLFFYKHEASLKLKANKLTAFRKAPGNLDFVPEEHRVYRKMLISRVFNGSGGAAYKQKAIIKSSTQQMKKPSFL